MTAKPLRQSTTAFTVVAFGTAKHAWTPYGTLPIGLQLLLSLVKRRIVGGKCI